MTLARLFHAAWPAWDLRCAFFPFVFIYPAQAAVFHAGWHDTRSLVFAGRTVMAFWSTLDLVLVYVIASRVWKREAVGVLAAVVLAAARLHVVAGKTMCHGLPLPDTGSTPSVTANASINM